MASMSWYTEVTVSSDVQGARTISTRGMLKGGFIC